MSHLTWFGTTVFEIDVWWQPVPPPGGFGGLSPSNKAPSLPKLECKALYISGFFVKFLNVNTTCTNVKSPIKDLLAMVLLVKNKGNE